MDTSSTSTNKTSSASILPFAEAKKPGRPLHATLGHSQCHRSFWGSNKSLGDSGPVSLGSSDLKVLETESCVPMGAVRREPITRENKPSDANSRVNNPEDTRRVQKKVKIVWREGGQHKRRKPSEPAVHR
mmetsp:Transcript_20346/g.38300  ORF Transcript_20346/g.38300 Transcript_20346/m.38300 type:complete len:130 (-) Transcript_20346:645-1034(-)